MGCLIHSFPLSFLVFTSGRMEKSTVELYFSVPVVLYAHMLIVVAFLVVKFFSCLVIPS